MLIISSYIFPNKYKMVKEENKIYSNANKCVLQFLSKIQVSEDLIEKWKNNGHQMKLKNIINHRQNIKPKRSISEYLLFCSQERPKMIQESLKENEKINIHDITRDLGKKWIEFKKLAENENSEEYIRLQQIKHEVSLDKERFLIEKSKLPIIKEKKKDYFRSKYIYFCHLERIKNPKISFTELSKLWLEKKNCEVFQQQYDSEKQISKIKNEN